MDVGTIVSWIQVALWLVAIASFVGRLARGETEIPTGMKKALSSEWFIGTVILLGLLGSGASVYLWYAHPKIVTKTVVVEKPVEKIIEKLVPQDCPKPVAPKHKNAPAPNPHATSQQQSGRDNVQTGPITSGPCSNVQVGGSGNQTTNCAPPQREISATDGRKMIAELCASSGKATFGVLGTDAGSETFIFARILKETFKGSGCWNVADEIVPMYNPNALPGVQVCWDYTGSSSFPPPVPTAALRALQGGHVKGVRPCPQNGMPKDSVLIVVGPNPDN